MPVFDDIRYEILSTMRNELGVDFSNMDPKYAEGINDTLKALKMFLDNQKERD